MMTTGVATMLFVNTTLNEISSSIINLSVHFEK